MPNPLLSLLRSAWSRCLLRFDRVADVLFPFEALESDPPPATLGRTVNFGPPLSSRIAALEFDLHRTRADLSSLRREYDTLRADRDNDRRQTREAFARMLHAQAVHTHDLEALTDRIGAAEDRFAARTDLFANPSTN